MNSLTNYWRQQKSATASFDRSCAKIYTPKNSNASKLSEDLFPDSFGSSFLLAVDKFEEEITEKPSKNASICGVKRCTPTKTNTNNNKRMKLNEIVMNYDHTATVIEESQLEIVHNDQQSPTTDLNSEKSTSQIDKHLLSSWGLPQCVLEKYHAMNITTMFQWQVDCLALGNVLNGGNLVYSAPTSAGKTLVAEILVLKRVLELRKKAIIILPFVSVAREKMFYLQNLFQGLGVRVDGFIGAHNPPGGWKRVDVAVCTIEKANSLINRLLEEKKLHTVGTIVVDELHMLGDPSRGYLLELLLTKVRYMSWKMGLQIGNEKENQIEMQIIGMSATLPNLDLLARWLDADLFNTDFRPVPLFQRIKFGNQLLDDNFKPIRQLASFDRLFRDPDGDNVIQLCLETVTQNHSVLIFCYAKARTEALARAIAHEFFMVGNTMSEETKKKSAQILLDFHHKLRSALDGNLLGDVLEQLRRSPSGLDAELSTCVKAGVAFHHAGLTFDERDIVEGAFRRGVIKVLVSTSTLSSGVNLPARRVIVRSPLAYGSQMMDVLSYRQMVGRAGRKGIDTEGESILICKKNELDMAKMLVTDQLKPISSCLLRNGPENLSSAMKRAVLEIIVSGIATSPDQVEQYCASTLLAASYSDQNNAGDADGAQKARNAVQSCIKYLMENEFIMLHVMGSADGLEEKMKYVSSSLGNAVLASSMPPDDGLIIFRELDRARKNFVLENELHIIYQVTPINVSDQWENLEWIDYLKIWDNLSSDQQRVGELVGVEERFIARLAANQGGANIRTKQYRQLAIHKRFYTALALQDLVNEVPLKTVALKFVCNRGRLQSLQQSASTFAGMVTSFCNRLGWINLELLLSQFQSRLNFGIQRELCDLVRLSLLNGQRARLIYNGGFESVADVANADPKLIETLFKTAGPFQSEKQRDNETDYEVKERRKARCIWLMGKEGYTEAEAAKLLVQEARYLLQKDLGVNIDWCQSGNESSGSSNENQTEEEGVQIRDSQAGTHSISVPKNGKNESTKAANQTKTEQNIAETPSTSPRRPKTKQNIAETPSTSPRRPKTKQNIAETPSTSPRRPKTKQNIAETPSTSPRRPKTKQNIAETPSTSPRRPKTKQNIAETPSTSPRRPKTEQNIAETPPTSPTRPKTALKNMAEAPSTSKTDPLDSPDTIPPSDDEETKPTTRFSFRKRVECSMMCDSLMMTSQLERLLDGNLSSNNPKPDENKSEIVVEDSLLASPACFPPPNATATSTPCLRTGAVKQNSSLFNDLSLEAYMGNYTSLNEMTDFEQSQAILEEEEAIPSEQDGKDNLQSLHLEESSEDSCETIESSQPIGQTRFTKLLRCSPRAEKTVAVLRRARSDPVPSTSGKISDDTMRILNAFTDSDFVPRKRAQKGKKLSENKLKKSQSWDVRFGGFGSEKSPNSSKCSTHPPTKRKLPFTKNKNRGGKRKIAAESDSDVRISDSDSSEDVKPRRKRAVDDEFVIIDVAADVQLYQTFVEEWKKQKKFSLSLACAKLAPKNEAIGAKIKRGGAKATKNGATGFEIEEKNVVVVGLSVVWEDRDAYYVSFVDTDQSEIESPSLSAQPLDPKLSISTRLNDVRDVLDSRTDCTIIAYDLKEHIRLLSVVTESFPTCRVEDPKVGVWLLDPTDNPKTIHNLVLEFCPEDKPVLEHVGGTVNARSVGLTPETRGSPRVRSAVEAVISFRVMNRVGKKLKDEKLMKSFQEIEMPSILLLCKMELNGLGFSVEEFRQQMQIIERNLSHLEGKAHQIAGRRFALKSTADVATVLFDELGLQPNGEKDQNRRTKVRGSIRKRSKEYNTTKATLEKMARNHKLPAIILEHRKLSSALDNMILPLLRTSRRAPRLQMERIFATSEHHTATGRVTMHEPNLQTVPRDIILVEAAQNGETSSVVNLRNAFIPFKGGILLAADYSQLELRILAHLSRDDELIGVLNAGGDVFKNIAAQWKEKEVQRVTDVERQQAKQICYGMVYGMGAKSLSEQLDVDESDGAVFLHDFKCKYKGMTKYMTKVVEQCREDGFVTTVMGRRRYLPSITSEEAAARCQAERQAVNTTVQGSAADLAKIAMLRIDGALKKEFFGCEKPYGNGKGVPGGASLVLQLHDELIYEVNDKILARVARIVKREMETALKLTVHLPVKLKCGHSWGSFEEYFIF